MHKKDFKTFRFLSVVFFIVILPSFSFATPVRKVTPVTSDEQDILEDREANIQSAIEAVVGEKGLKKTKPKKADSKEKQKPAEKVEAKTASPAPIKIKEKKEWFSSSKKESSASNLTKKKRKERQEQFKSLEPGYVKESITETKIEAKQKFVSTGKHDLNHVIQRAIEVHLPAQIARERVELSESRIKKAFRDFFSDAEFTNTSKDGSLSGAAYKSRNFRLNLRQPIFHGGVLWNAFKMEEANRETALKEYDKTVSDLIADTSKAYFEYERAWNVFQDRKRLSEFTFDMKQMSDQKERAKLISDIEKLNIDSLTSQVQYDLETAQQDFELAKLEFQRFLQLDISDSVDLEPVYHIENIQLVDLKGEPVVFSEASTDVKSSATGQSSTPTDNVIPQKVQINVNEKDVNHYIDLAYANRSDLQVEASKLRSVRLSHKISQGKLLPNADFIVELGKLGEAYQGVNRRFWGDLETTKPPYHKEFRVGAEFSWNAAGNTVKYSYDRDERAPSLTQFSEQSGASSIARTFSVSLLDNLNSLADLKETKIATLEQVVELEKTERDVIREVKEAYFNYNKALIQVESNFKRMNYRDHLAKLAEAHRLETNEIQVSEFLQSQIDYTEERALVHKALSDFYLSKANFNRAIGVRDYLKMNPVDLKK